METLEFIFMVFCCFAWGIFCGWNVRPTWVMLLLCFCGGYAISRVFVILCM